MTLPFMNELTLRSPLLGLVVVLGLVLYAAVSYNVSKKRPARRATHTSYPKSIKEASKRKTRIISTLLVLGFCVGAIAAANPATVVLTATEQAEICFVADGSTSMLAEDIDGGTLTRDEGKKKAMRAFVEAAPEDLKICVVSFAGPDNIDLVIESTLNRAEALDRIDEIELADGTAAGGALALTLETVESQEDNPLPSAEAVAKGEKAPVVFVLLSDGKSYDEYDVVDLDVAAQRVADRGVRVFTVAYGTPEGFYPKVREDGTVINIPAPPDPEQLQRVSDITDAKLYETADSTTLEEIFNSVTAEVAMEENFESIAYLFAFGGILLGIASAILRKRWVGRI